MLFVNCLGSGDHLCHIHITYLPLYMSFVSIYTLFLFMRPVSLYRADIMQRPRNETPWFVYSLRFPMSENCLRSLKFNILHRYCKAAVSLHNPMIHSIYIMITYVHLLQMYHAIYLRWVTKILEQLIRKQFIMQKFLR